MIADDNDELRHPDLIPEDEAAAMRRFEAVRPLDPAALVAVGKQDLLLAWWIFCWLNAALHPDDAEVWPEEVADALPLAAEARRRSEAGRDRLRRILPHRSRPPPHPARAVGGFRTQQKSGPVRNVDRSDRTLQGGPVWENSPPLYGAGFL